MNSQVISDVIRLWRQTVLHQNTFLIFDLEQKAMKIILNAADIFTVH